MIECDLQAIGLIAPGITGWRQGIPVLAGEVAYRPEPIVTPQPRLLSSSERRRTTDFIKLVLAAADEAMGKRDRAIAQVHSVFASSGGDTEVVDRICDSLNTPGRPVSPTHFHNSVHNAAAGHWAIAAGCTEASISISGHDRSFCFGLLEAASTVATEGADVLLVACDTPPPFPLSEVRDVTAPFAVAMLLGPSGERTDRLAGLRLRLRSGQAETRLIDPELEALRRANPAARSLPLLHTIARGGRSEIAVTHSASHALHIELGP